MSAIHTLTTDKCASAVRTVQIVICTPSLNNYIRVFGTDEWQVIGQSTSLLNAIADLLPQLTRTYLLEITIQNVKIIVIVGINAISGAQHFRILTRSPYLPSSQDCRSRTFRVEHAIERRILCSSPLRIPPAPLHSIAQGTGVPVQKSKMGEPS